MKFLPNPIQWYEGMLLLPQHFQQADLLHRQTIDYHFSLLSPYHWGVIELDFDASKLIQGIFEVLKLEALLPDGTIIFFPQSHTDVLNFDLTPFISTLREGPLWIYLIFPEEIDNEEKSALHRYESIESSAVADHNSGDNKVAISRLKPRLSLTAGRQPPPHCACLPLIQIALNGNTFVKTSYVPPYLQVKLADRIGKMCSYVIKRVRDKLLYIQEKIQNLPPQAIDLPHNRDLQNMRTQLIGGLLPFEAMLHTEKAHPYALFISLTQMAAQAASLRRYYYLEAFEIYQHHHLFHCFEKMTQFMEYTLNTIEENYQSINFKQQDRLYNLYLQKIWNHDVLVLGAKIQSNMSEDEMLKWIEECVIATDSHVALARENRVLGAHRQIVGEVAAMNLIPPRGTLLFLVKNDDRFIKMEENLWIFNISDTPECRPEKIVFYLPHQV